MGATQATEPRTGRLPGTETLAAALGLAVVYFAAGKFGLSLAFVNASASAVWPPTGLALAALLLWGLRLWPGVFLGAFLVNITTQGSVATTLGIAMGNTLEAVLAAGAIRRFAGGLQVFERVRDVFKYLLLAPGFSTALCASVGVGSLCLGGFARWEHFGPIWLTWWLGDLISDLTIAPLLVIWATRGVFRWNAQQRWEAAGLLVTVLATGWLLFIATPADRAFRFPLQYLALPPLLWAALRFDQRGAATCAVLSSAIALWGTLHGLGPFARSDPNEALLLVQAFMGTMSLTALLVAALMSERNQAETALHRARDELAAANTDLEDKVQARTTELRELVDELEHFSYAIVHDMRAPLRAMQGFAALVEEELAGSGRPDLLDYLERIRSSAVRLDTLVQDVLTYKEVVRHRPVLHPIDLSELLLTLLKSYPELQAPKAEILVESPLPMVLGTVSGLTQCFSNLLGNAVKFVAPGVTPRVRVWAQPVQEMRKVECGRWNPENEQGAADSGAVHSAFRIPNSALIRVWVEDNGIGIPAQWHERIFDMFQRASPGYEGTGIGLAIVRKVAERMEGRAGVESVPKQGSRFWVELRAAPRV